MAKRPERKTTALYSGPAAVPAPAGPDRLFGLSGTLPHLVELDLEWIDPRPDQPRTVFDEDALQSLADSIRLHGLKQPILVHQETGGRYTLVAGERRLRAHRMLQARTIAAIVVKDDDPDATALIENMQRVDLDAVDQATAVRRLIDRHGYTQEQVAPFIGVTSHTQVSRLLNILRLTPEILAEYRSRADRISRATLQEIAESDDPAQQAALWEQAKTGLGSKQIRAQKKPASAAHPTEALVLRNIGQAMIRLSREVQVLTSRREALVTEHRERLRALRDALNHLLEEPEAAESP